MDLSIRTCLYMVSLITCNYINIRSLSQNWLALYRLRTQPIQEKHIQYRKNSTSIAQQILME